VADKRFIHQENVVEALKMLQAVVTTLDAHHIAYYLDFGTLLGAMREGALIPWDDDLDISLLNPSDYPKAQEVLREIQKRYRYRTYLFTFRSSREKRRKNHNPIFHEHISFASDEDFQIAKLRTNKFWIFGRGNTTMDIFFKYSFEGGLYWLADGRINRIDASLLEQGVKQIDFCGISCSVPVAYEAYLSQLYGEWQIPNRTWREDESPTQLQGECL